MLHALWLPEITIRQGHLWMGTLTVEAFPVAGAGQLATSVTLPKHKRQEKWSLPQAHSVVFVNTSLENFTLAGGENRVLKFG